MEVEDLDKTLRGEGGFGSTGVQLDSKVENTKEGDKIEGV